MIEGDITTHLAKGWQERVGDQNVTSDVCVFLERALLVVPMTWNIHGATSDTIGISCNSSGDEMIDMVRYCALRDRLVSNA